MRACRRPSSAPQPSTSVIVVLDPVGVICCFMVFSWLLFLCRVRFTPTECHRSQMTILKLFLFSGAILVQLKSAVVVLHIGQAGFQDSALDLPGENSWDFSLHHGWDTSRPIVVLVTTIQKGDG